MAQRGPWVLVHGGFVDGSGWQGVYDELKKDGYTVSVVQNPTLSHADDVAVTKRVIDAQSEPVILVGHSCPHRTGFCSSTARSSMSHSRAT